MASDYGANPEVLELRAKLLAANAKRSGLLDRATGEARRRRKKVQDAYRSLFFGDELVLGPAAAIVLDDLAEAAGLGAAASLTDHAELCILEGRRRMMLHLLSRLALPPERAADVSTQVETYR